MVVVRYVNQIRFYLVIYVESFTYSYYIRIFLAV